MRIRLTVNGTPREVKVPPGTRLLSVLRDDLDLTASRYGCGRGDCGACYVLVGGRAVPSCTLPVEEAEGLEVTTVEGLADGERLHPVQQAFLDADAMECGYCTSGMLISAVALLDRTSHPSDDEIREALGSHLCRCGVYLRAFRAVKQAAARQAAEAGA